MMPILRLIFLVLLFAPLAPSTSPWAADVEEGQLHGDIVERSAKKANMVSAFDEIRLAGDLAATQLLRGADSERVHEELERKIREIVTEHKNGGPSMAHALAAGIFLELEPCIAGWLTKALIIHLIAIAAIIAIIIALLIFSFLSKQQKPLEASAGDDEANSLSRGSAKGKELPEGTPLVRPPSPSPPAASTLRATRSLSLSATPTAKKAPNATQTATRPLRPASPPLLPRATQTTVAPPKPLEKPASMRPTAAIGDVNGGQQPPKLPSVTEYTVKKTMMTHHTRDVVKQRPIWEEPYAPTATAGSGDGGQRLPSAI